MYDNTFSLFYVFDDGSGKTYDFIINDRPQHSEDLVAYPKLTDEYINKSDMRTADTDEDAYYEFDDKYYIYSKGKLSQIKWFDDEHVYMLIGNPMLYDYPKVDNTYMSKLLVLNSVVSTDAGMITKGGKSVSFSLYDELNKNADTDIEIAIIPNYASDGNYVYNGKTINQYQKEWEEDSVLSEKYGQIVKDGDMLKYGEALYTTGSPEGEKWDKDFYYTRVNFYGEDFLKKYIVNGEFLRDKVLEDQAEYQKEHLTTNYAYAVLHEAIDAYKTEKIQETISQLKQQNIKYEYKEAKSILVFYVTSEQFERLSIDNVSSYDLYTSVANGITVDM